MLLLLQWVLTSRIILSKGKTRLSTANFLGHAAAWFLDSGIREAAGGVARYYHKDLQANAPISTEITGYTVSALVYLHSLTGLEKYLEAARTEADYLTNIAWNRELEVFPFEFSITSDPVEPLSFFFDSGIIVRGLLSIWRATRHALYLDTASECASGMAKHFGNSDDDFHPVLCLPDKAPLDRDRRWSRSPGCYQLKAALGWRELSEVTGEQRYAQFYHRMLAYSLSAHEQFLPGDTDPARVMDRLHAYCYFLEGLLPCAQEPEYGQVLLEGIDRVAEHLHEIAPSFARSDVYAQLLRLRLLVELLNQGEVDRLQAGEEARALASFQASHPDRRIGGGFYFGRKGKELLPHVNPVSTAFGLQTLSMWNQYREGNLRLNWQMLI